MLKKKLVDVLISMGVLTEQQADDVTKEQRQSGTPISKILLTKGFLSQHDLARGLSEQIGVPFIPSITEQMADLKLLSKVPLRFLRKHVVMPIMFEGQKTIVTADPNDLQPLDDIVLLMDGDIRYAVSTSTAISDAINRYYPLETSSEMMDELEQTSEDGLILKEGDLEEKDIMEMANEAPIVKLVNHVIYQAVKEDASDIHIESFEKELRVRYRIDGNMYQRVVPPKRYQGAIVSRIKIMSNLNIAEKRIPQDGRIQIKVADKTMDLRVSILPCNFGERVVMRLLDKTKGAAELENLDLSERDLNLIKITIERPNGIILVSGPTGSGKTTTLYSILQRLNKPDVNIITVEDPVEYTMHGIGQVQVNEKAGLTFPIALRSILRQDPDVVLIGEIRDAQTAQISTQAALTGHLVLSTIHTNSAPATITRLIDMGIEPFLIASSLICVISQRLVRKLCDACKQPYHPVKELISRLGITSKAANNITFHKAIGCDECLKTGYRGRVAIFEIMEITDAIGQLIIERSDVTTIRKQAIKDGMTALSVDGVRNIAAGKTTIEEVLAVAYAEYTADNVV